MFKAAGLADGFLKADDAFSHVADNHHENCEKPQAVDLGAIGAACRGAAAKFGW